MQEAVVHLRESIVRITLAAIGAGGLMFAVEALDRVIVLKDGFDSASQIALYVGLTGSVVVTVAAITLIAGILVAVVDLLHRTIETRFFTHSPRKSAYTLLTTVGVVGVAARVLSGFFAWALQEPFARIVRRIDTRLFNLGILAAYPKIVFTILLFCAAFVVVIATKWLFSEVQTPRKWVTAALVLTGILAVITGYWADSRVEFTRYEYMFHLPLLVLYSTVAFVTFLVVLRGRAPAAALGSRWVAVAVALTVLLGAISLPLGAVAMNSSQNVKALFWGRSIIARRAFQVGRALADGDGDGFSDVFGAADSDDSDSHVNGLAAEIPGNGIDDNCIGGDMPEALDVAGSLFNARLADSQPRPAPRTAKRRDVILLTVDCLRADHLGCYGYNRPTSPNLDAFAAHSVLFELPFAEGTNTGHSFVSLFRSSYADDLFDDRIPTLAAVLRENGYQTLFLNSVRTDTWLNASRWGKYKQLMEGFDALHNDGDQYLNADQLVDRAIEVFKNQDPNTPHFTWVHFFDCHRPRRHHPQFGYGKSQKGRFDGNVAFVDQALGRLFEYFEQSGRYESTLVIISADHGEAFLEHGAMDHSNKPYNNNTFVPLLIKSPDAAAGRFAQPCGLIDVAPTILGHCGIARPACYRGVDLIDGYLKGGIASRPIVSETPRNLIESSFYTWAMVQWPYKIMWDVRSDSVEVYKIDEDFDERHNLVDRDPGLAARMRQALGEWLDRETARTGAVGPAGDEGIGDE